MADLVRTQLPLSGLHVTASQSLQLLRLLVAHSQLGISPLFFSFQDPRIQLRVTRSQMYRGQSNHLSTFLDPILTTLILSSPPSLACIMPHSRPFKRLNPVTLLPCGFPITQRLSRHMAHLRTPTLADVKIFASVYPRTRTSGTVKTPPNDRSWSFHP